MEKQTKIILVSGKRKSGKTTICKELEKMFFNKIVKKYNFADSLKKFCVEYLYLDPKLVWGSDNDKNTITTWRWENLPHYSDLLTDKSGFMTIREVLQEWGNGVFRKINNRYWIDRLLREIKYDQPDIGLIGDVRYINEVEYIKNNFPCKIIRLTRNSDSKDNHISEIDLDNYNFDYIVDNINQSVEETADEVLKKIHQFI